MLDVQSRALMGIIQEQSMSEIDRIDSMYLQSCLITLAVLIALYIVTLPVLRNQKIYSQKIIMLVSRLNQKELDAEVLKLRSFEQILSTPNWIMTDYLYIMIDKASQKDNGMDKSLAEVPNLQQSVLGGVSQRNPNMTANMNANASVFRSGSVTDRYVKKTTTVKSTAQIYSKIYDTRVMFLGLSKQLLMRIFLILCFLLTLVIVVQVQNTSLRPSIELLVQTINGDFSITNLYV